MFSSICTGACTVATEFNKFKTTLGGFFTLSLDTTAYGGTAETTAAIAFDVVFSEPDRLNPDIAADTFRSLDEATVVRRFW